MNSSSESIVVGGGVVRGVGGWMVLQRLLLISDELAWVASAIGASADFLFRV